MGFNTTMIVLNDALQYISKDPDFGKKVAEAIEEFDHRRYVCEKNGLHFHGVDVGAGAPDGGIHGNAATVVETHHADGVAVVAVGGNCAVPMTKHPCSYLAKNTGKDEDKVQILKDLAEQLGYRVSKIPEKKNK